MIPTTYAIGWHDGWLCVVATSNDFSEPKAVSVYWPVERTPKAVADELVGADVKQALPGQYVVWPVERWRPVINLTCKDGGRTQSIHTVSREVRPPKVSGKTPVEYRNGRWYKRLSRGWVEA